MNNNIILLYLISVYTRKSWLDRETLVRNAIIVDRMRKMIYNSVKHSSEQTRCTIYTTDSVPLPRSATANTRSHYPLFPNVFAVFSNYIKYPLPKYLPESWTHQTKQRFRRTKTKTKTGYLELIEHSKEIIRVHSKIYSQIYSQIYYS